MDEKQKVTIVRCPRCGEKAFLVFSYMRRNGLNKYTKEKYRQNRRSDYVIFKQYECCNGHGQFLCKSDKPIPDKYAFGVDRPSFDIINPYIDWATKEDWEKREKAQVSQKKS